MRVRVRYGLAAGLLLLLAGCNGLNGGNESDETQPPPDLLRAPDVVAAPPQAGSTANPADGNAAKGNTAVPNTPAHGAEPPAKAH